MSEVLHQRGERPAFVIDADGWRVYISVHDQAYLRAYAEWRARVIASHPDKPGGSHEKAVKVSAAFDKWKAREEAWYAQYVHPATLAPLEPPLIKRGGAHPARPMHLGLSYAKMTQQVLEALQDGLPHTLAQIEHQIGRSCSPGALASALHRLRLRGAQFSTERRDDGPTWYRLLALPARPHAGRLPDRITTALKARPYTCRELASAIGANRVATYGVISRLRQRGLPIRTSRGDDGRQVYHLASA